MLTTVETSRPCVYGLGRESSWFFGSRRGPSVSGVHAPVARWVAAYAGWLYARHRDFLAQIKSAALDPFRRYANARSESLSDAVQVLKAFHVVKIGTQVVYEVRRRVEQERLGCPGHQDDRSTSSVALTCRVDHPEPSTRWPRSGR